MIKINFPIEHSGWNFYAVANLSDVSTPQDAGGAVRAELVLGPAELAVTVNRAVRQGPWQFGLDASSGVGLFDLRFEGTAQRDVSQPFVPKGWRVQALGGVEVTLRYANDDTVTFGAEYFYNELGYEDAALYPQVLLAFAQAGQPIPLLYLGREYIAAFVHLPHPGAFNMGTLTGSVICNLADLSAVSRLDLQVRLLTYMDFNMYGTYHFGREGELRFPIHIPAGALAGVPMGFSQPPPRSEVGAGLRLYF